MIRNQRRALPMLILLASSTAHADALQFTVDSTQSYLTLNIPNYSMSGNSINFTGQNRTNGAPDRNGLVGQHNDRQHRVHVGNDCHYGWR